MKNFFIFLIFLILLALSYFLINNSSNLQGGKQELKEFAIEDTSTVDIIYISKLNGENVRLSRRDSKTWLVNDKFPARPDAINLILKTLHDIEVQQSVPKTKLNRVIKRIAAAGTKVEFYTGNKSPEKVWYIGDPTASKVGTYMLLEEDGEKSSKPYVTHLLMERGYLGSRFFSQKSLWRDRIVMRSNPRSIKKLRVTQGTDSLESFEITKVDTVSFKIKNLDTQESFDLDPEKAIEYLKLFSGVYYEYLDVKTPKEELDSIYNSKPRHHLTIDFENGQTVDLKVFNLPVVKGATLGGEIIDFHPERMYIRSSAMSPKDYPIVQNLTFDPLVPGFKAFASSTNVEK